MRPFHFAFLIFLATAACAQQTTQSTGTTSSQASAEASLQARLDAADCLELRVAMKEALAAEEEATVQPQSGDVDLETDRPDGIASLFIPIPLGTIGRVVEGTESEEPEEIVDAETLYRRAHATYESKGCVPSVPYGGY